MRKGRKQSGFVLITIAISAVMLFGACGLVVDLGRLYVVRNELQVFADSAALVAATRLNGETGGITRAKNEIATMRNANRWHLGTQTLTADAVTIEFGRSLNGGPPDSWTTIPPDPPLNYSFVRVTPRVAVPVHFMPILTGSLTNNVSTAATAGQVASESPTGMFPFTPVAHNRVAPDFGMEAGKQYTLRWASSPKVGQNTCNGDDAQQWINLQAQRGSSNRGFYGSTAASDVWNQVANDKPVEAYRIGDHVNLSGGAMTTVNEALVQRIGSDPDPFSPTFNVYRDRGRNRRIITAPLTDPAANNEVVGFGRFFLLPARHYDRAGGNDPWCAEYIGAGAPEGSDSKGASPSAGMFTKVRLWH